MLKKLLSLLIVATLILSCIGAVSVSAEDIVSEVITFEDTGVDVGETVSDVPNSAWDNGGYYWINADMDAYYVAKFDLSNYVFPVKKVELKIHYRESGVGTTYVFAVPNNWSAGTSEDSLTYNKLVALTEGKLTKEDAEFSINWNGGLNGGTSYYSSALDITALVNERLSAPGAEKVLSLAIARTTNDGESAVHRISKKKAKLIITQDEPVYSTDGSATIITLADYGKISPGAPDAVTELGAAGSSSSAYQLSYVSAKGVPYGQREMVYMKFDLSNLGGTIENATLNLKHTCQTRTHYVVVYLVENDTWTHETLTWNNTFDTSNLTGSASVDFNGTGENIITAENLPAAKAFAPNPAKYVTYTASTNEKNPLFDYSLDVTELVKGQENDGAVTLAFSIYSTSAASRFYGLHIGSTNPTLNITTTSTGVSTEEIKVKINDQETDVLSSGIISASVEATSTMGTVQRTTMILAVYEGNRLSKLYVSPQQKINDKNTNGGKTTVSVTSGEEIEVTSDTRISAFMWKDISLPLPLGTVKTIRP